MRFQIKKLLEGYDPADLIEQSMYCFGSDDGGGGGGGDSSSMGMDDDVSAQASVSDSSSNNDSSSDMGIDSSVADQQNVSANTNAQDNFSNMDNFSYPNAQNFSTNLTNVPEIGIDAFGGIGGAMSNQSTAGIQSALGDMAGGSMVEVDPISGQTTSYSPTQVPELEVMPQIDPYDIQQTGLQNLAQNIGLANMTNSGLSPEAMASIGTTGYSPDSVTGFANHTDVSDFTTADQMASMSNVNNMAQKGMFPNIPTPLGAVINNISKMGSQNTIDNINMGYTPTYSGGQVTGTTGFGIGMGSPTGAVDGYGIFSNTSPSEMSFGGMNNMGGGETEPIKPATTNPVSGQPICPDGYRFDDDLQACRLDTTRPNRPNNPNPFPASEAYYRATSLDKAPMNLPSGFDFNKANQNFVSQFAYRPSAYQNQMGLSGFTPFRRS